MRHIRRRWLVRSLPAIVTRPRFSECLYCRWLPTVVTRYQPSASISLIISRTFRGTDHSISYCSRLYRDAVEGWRLAAGMLRDPWDSGTSGRLAPCPGAPASVVLPQRPAVKLRQNSPRKIDVVPGDRSEIQIKLLTCVGTAGFEPATP